MEDSAEFTVVPRVTSFANQYVTKALYSDNEKLISSIATLIFDNDGKLIDVQEATGVSSLTINKTALRKQSVSDAKIVLFANIGLDKIKDASGTSLKTNFTNKVNIVYSDLENYTYDLSSHSTVLSSPLPEGFTGFPMVGGTSANLTATSSQQAAIQVNLKILYAKVNFVITVDDVTENQDITTNGVSFSLSGYTVHNIPQTTSLSTPSVNGEVEHDFLGNAIKTEEGEDLIASTDDATRSTYASLYPASGVIAATGTSSIKTTGSKASFTFYVAENHYNHNCNLASIYPATWGNSEHYESLKQQYKPEIAKQSSVTGSEATYVTVKGTYNDYRGTAWDVHYKIYLGKDNKENFHVDRNSEYTNYLTIKGIRNNDSYGDGDVWIDHRVNVSTDDLSKYITITRETLIDSHIEVRPLRVDLGGNYAAVRLKLPDVNWIAAERFTGANCQDGSVYCYAGSKSTGKRKYFTTTLLNELKSAVGEDGYITLLNNECAWIYFDENSTASNRTAEIKIDFLNAGGNTIGSEVYTVVQRGLQKIGTFFVESYEEYLHSYDSADKYNLSTSPTDYTQQGLAWGLDNTSVSQTQIASATTLPALNLYADLQYVKDIRYDFWHKSDGSYNVYSAGNSWGNLSDAVKNQETGMVFTNRATDNLDITIIDMGTKPSNAYQYCLSKNKFKEDASGNHTMDIHWYVPDVYELESVLKANTGTKDFNNDAYYWSSQPSFTDQLNSDVLDYLAGIFGGEVAIVDENVEYARAASSTSTKGADVLRTTNNRIRCFYSAEGIKNVDMSERAPDGMGGIFNFWMKGWTDGGKNTAGFFNYLLPSPSTSTGDPVTSDVPNVTYPTKDNSQSADAEFRYIVTTGKNGQIEGFEKNPGDKNNWNEYNLRDGFYYTLRDYPGLSDYTLNKAAAANAYEETSTRKSITESSTTTSKVEKTQSLPSTFTLNPLNDKLTITFDQCDGDNVSVFTYDELYSQVKTTSTQYWNKPVYTSTTYELNPETQTPSSQGSGSETGISTGTSRAQEASVESAKKVAFDGTRDVSTTTHNVDGAYPKAKSDAKGKLDELLKAYPTSDGWVHGSYNYTSLSWNQEVANIQWSQPKIETGSYWTLWDGTVTYTKKVTITCSVTVTASMTVTKPGTKTLYLQTEGTGVWSTATTTTESSGPTVNTDQLRVYSGNSLTISVNAANSNDYVISKVKVYISGGNRIKNVPISSDLTTDNYYARFVDSILIPQGRGQIAYAEQGMFDYGSGEYIVLEGMEYSGDSTDSAVWQQWTGYDNSVTLVLADYKVATRAGFNAKYTYQTADADKSKYIIIDRIEVKCTKKQ